jgi:hypothetical protein
MGRRGSVAHEGEGTAAVGSRRGRATTVGRVWRATAERERGAGERMWVVGGGVSATAVSSNGRDIDQGMKTRRRGRGTETVVAA